MDNQELGPDELDAIHELPREREPEGALEERTVRALRSLGLLASPTKCLFQVTPAGLTAAAAFVLVLAAGAFVAGQLTGVRQSAGAMLAVQKLNNERLAASIQEAGTAYVIALSALATLATPDQGREMALGREVARSAFYAVADEMAGIFPEDPVAVRILKLLEQEGWQRQLDHECQLEKHYIWY